MKAHLLVFDGSQITRELIVEKIDHNPAIENWYAFFDNTICLASEEDARSQSSLLHAKLPKLAGGMLPKPIWAFLNHPQSADAAADA